MRVIIADDDPVTLRLLEKGVSQWGYEVLAARDGDEAWDALCTTEGPRIAILDWMMPGTDGVELCRKVRSRDDFDYIYIVLLTCKDSLNDIVTGLEAGADDYITKPFDHQELRSRIKTGERLVQLQHALASRNQALAQAVRKLEDALATIRQLHGLLPICSYCKRIRDDEDYWHQIEAYVAQHSETEFTHGLCPECHEKHVKPQLEALRARDERGAALGQAQDHLRPAGGCAALAPRGHPQPSRGAETLPTCCTGGTDEDPPG